MSQYYYDWLANKPLRMLKRSAERLKNNRQNPDIGTLFHDMHKRACSHRIACIKFAPLGDEH